jgi:hypothetical protein
MNVETELEEILRTVFVSGLRLGLRMKELPEKLAPQIAAANGDSAKVESVIEAEVNRICDEVFAFKKPAGQA